MYGKFYLYGLLLLIYDMRYQPITFRYVLYIYIYYNFIERVKYRFGDIYQTANTKFASFMQHFLVLILIMKLPGTTNFLFQI